MSDNYFELFQIPLAYQVDLADLAQRYREAQQSIHPDRYASAPDMERRLAAQQAMMINDAYRTLRDPLLRAEYLLGLKGIELVAGQTIQDKTFLMEQMELREEMDDVRIKGDVTGLALLMRRIDAYIAALQADLTVQFAENTAESYQQAYLKVQKLSFFMRLRSESESIEDGLII